MQNIVLDGQFTSNEMTNFTEVSNTDWRHADKGWLVGSNSKWSENLIGQNVIADNSGAGALTQVITNNSLNQGLQLVSFDSINLGNNNTLRLQVYGINGDFRMGLRNTSDPKPRNKQEPLDYSVLLDTGNLANQQYDWKNFSELVNFGDGYQYIAIRFFTRGVEAEELMEIDNVAIGPDILPAVADDRVVTKKGVSKIIDVLENDTSSSLANIQIESFTQPYNGVVTYEEGKLLYVPDDGLVGRDSFEYTIIDDRGRTSTGNVEITIQNPTYDIGVHLNEVSYHSPQYPFLDLFKTAREWKTETKGNSNTREFHLLDLDEHGWVKSLPTEQDDVNYDYVTTKINIDPDRIGQYVVLYEGEGELVYSNGAEVISSEPGKDIIETSTSKKQVKISLLETDPDRTGDYLRNIRIVPIEYADIYQTETFDSEQPEIFNPNFLNHIDSFTTLRFMGWMETNNSEQSEWADRPTVDDYIYSQSSGVPVEVMVELANQNDSNPWFNMPHMATDEYVENFARYVKDNLEPELDIYVEYSSEVWNKNLEQAQWVKEQASLEGMTSADWYSRRTTQITQIWDDVFDGDKERVLGVMGARSTKSEDVRDLLNYNWAGENALSNEEYGIDAIGIAPYFGRYIGKSKHTSEILSWLDDGITSAMDNLYTEITSGLLSNRPKGGALQAVYEDLEEYGEISKEYGLSLVAYEGGQSLVSLDRNFRVMNLFEKFNADPRMGTIYEEYLQKWFEIGGGEFITFSDVKKNNQYGYWGLSEALNQSSPKYDAVIGLANTNV